MNPALLAIMALGSGLVLYLLTTEILQATRGERVARESARLVGCSVAVAVTVGLLGIGLLYQRRQQERFHAAASPLEPLVATAAELCQRTATATNQSASIRDPGRLIWIAMPEPRVHSSIIDLSDRRRAQNAEDVQTIACSREEWTKVGDYAGGSGSALRWRAQVWLVDRQSGGVMASREFDGRDPPSEHLVRRGEHRDEKGEDGISQVVAWLNNPTR